jgi:uncharacterized protein (UPF0305 family)
VERIETCSRNSVGGITMKRIKNFVKNTFKNYPKAERDELIESITEMLIEKVEDLMDKGYSKEDAIDKTVLEFGTVEDYEEKPKRMKMRLQVEKTIRHYRNDMLFSLLGSIIIIGMLLFTNLHFSGNEVLWFVLPALAVLWWPLATLYRYLNKRETFRGNKDE